MTRQIHITIEKLDNDQQAVTVNADPPMTNDDLIEQLYTIASSIADQPEKWYGYEEIH